MRTEKMEIKMVSRKMATKSEMVKAFEDALSETVLEKLAGFRFCVTRRCGQPGVVIDALKVLPEDPDDCGITKYRFGCNRLALDNGVKNTSEYQELVGKYRLPVNMKPSKEKLEIFESWNDAHEYVECEYLMYNIEYFIPVDNFGEEALVKAAKMFAGA